MNVSIFSQKDYENKSNWTIGQNKPNSNPISSKAKIACQKIRPYSFPSLGKKIIDMLLLLWNNETPYEV